MSALSDKCTCRNGIRGKACADYHGIEERHLMSFDRPHLPNGNGKSTWIIGGIKPAYEFLEDRIKELEQEHAEDLLVIAGLVSALERIASDWAIPIHAVPIAKEALEEFKKNLKR